MSQDPRNNIRPAPRGLMPLVVTLGPGIVLVGGVIGSGELINTPIQAAQFGFVLLWAVIFSCIIKYFLQVEVARHCMIHNRSVFEALNLCPGPVFFHTSWFVFVFMVTWTLAQVGSAGILGSLGGVSHKLIPISESAPTGGDPALFYGRAWAVVIAILAQVLLWKGLYNRLEKVIIVLVLGFSLSVVAGLVLLQGTELAITQQEVISGLVPSLGPEAQSEEGNRLAAYAVIALIGALGVTGIELLIYPYWILEKGYARYVGASTREGWLERAKGWIRIVKIDAGFATILATVITACYFLLGAAVLFRKGVRPEGIDVVDQMSVIFTATYGDWSRLIFLTAGFCTLFSTLLAATAANGRIFTDFFCSLGLVDRRNERMVQRSHRTVQTLFLLSVLSIFLFLPKNPEKLVILSHYVIGLIGTPLAVVGIGYLAFQTDRRVRMGWVGGGLLVVSAGVLVTCLVVGFARQQGWI